MNWQDLDRGIVATVNAGTDSIIVSTMRVHKLETRAIMIAIGALAALMLVVPAEAVFAADTRDSLPLFVEVPGTNVGPIPDRPPETTPCGPPAGPPRDILFQVSSLNFTVEDVEVELAGNHGYVGDLTVELIAPGGSPRHMVFGRLGVTSPFGCGYGADLDGTYIFSDAASPPAGGFWQAAVGVDNVPSGSYRTTDSGGAGATSPMPATSLRDTFGGLPGSAAGGTWILRVTDSATQITGTISSANLRLYRATETIFANGFERLATTSLREGFDDIATLPAAGWLQINRSNPLGTTNWAQGSLNQFPGHQGGSDSYISANFNNTAGSTGTISNWLITPPLTFSGSSSFSFWTRTVAGSQWADRLEVRLCTGPSCTDVGGTATSVGGFSTRLLVINDLLFEGGYPEVWTRYTFTGGLPASGQGRIAFRYNVSLAGPNGTHSNYIGIDSVEFDGITILGDDAGVPAAVIDQLPTTGSDKARD